jgi:hypothetical protein
MKHWSPEDIATLRELYPNKDSQFLAELFGRPVFSIYNKVYALGLKKSKEFIANQCRERISDPNHPARKYWMKKGCIPPNKGKRIVEYMSFEAIKRVKATQFKPGNKPENYRPVGDERIDSDGYIEIKVMDGLDGWNLKHRVIWEKQNGKIPEGYNIQFKDGNPQNCIIENLYMISRSDQMKNENSFHAKYPQDVKKLIQLKGALSRQINKI